MDAEMVEGSVDLVTTYGISVIAGIAILVVGWIVAGTVSRMVRRGLTRTEAVDPMLVGFFASLAKYTVLAVTVIAVLHQFGVQTTSLIAVLGAAGLAIGLALQGTLSNVAAGVMLLIFRPFRIGDYIDAGGVAGTVKELSLFVTELATPDNVQIIVPNAAIWGTTLWNYSHHETRRVDFAIGISYGDDIDQAFQILKQVVEEEQRVLAEPEPQIVVGNLGESSVDLIVRIWARADDYWPLKFDLTKRFKEALEAGNVTIPFPQRDVHLYQGGAGV